MKNKLLLFALAVTLASVFGAQAAAARPQNPQPSPTPERSPAAERLPAKNDTTKARGERGARAKDLTKDSGVNSNPRAAASDDAPEGVTPQQKAAALRAFAQYVLMHPDEFTKEAEMQKIKDAATVEAIMQRVEVHEGNPALDAKLKSGAELIKQMRSMISNSTGKPKVSEAEEISSEAGRVVNTKNEYGGKTVSYDDYWDTTLYYDHRGKLREWRDFDLLNETFSVTYFDRTGTNTIYYRHWTGEGVVLIEWIDKTLTPDPSKDTGDGRGLPAGARGVEAKPKTKAEMEAERKRQVTLPGEGHPEGERGTVDTEEALEHQQKKQTDGRITPNPNEEPVVRTDGPPAPKPGKGPEQVDKTRKPPKGTKPDDPTQSQKPKP